MFGRLLVLHRDEDVVTNGCAVYLCRCQCGTLVSVNGSNLRLGRKRSCGCLHKGCQVKDMTNQRFGRLLVLQRDGSGGGQALWLCQCDCGKKVTLMGGNLRNGSTTSCGCFQVECTRKRSVHDVSGRRFGRLTVIGPGESSGSNAGWVCRCDCGTIRTFRGVCLERGSTKSCGCLGRENTRKRNCKNIVGQKFGRLTVIAKTEERRQRQVMWVCKCECGNTIDVRGASLRLGGTNSCGCIRKEMVGPKHPSWNPNLTDEDRMERRLIPEYTEWRKRVMQRDRYRCRLCGAKGDICAHHLDAWGWCRSKRFLVSNGVTLCWGCHREFHSAYGNVCKARQFVFWKRIKTRTKQKDTVNA